jgi:putative membrane protein
MADVVIVNTQAICVSANQGDTTMSDQIEPDSGKVDASVSFSLQRTVLAHERTMLAWVRTSTSLITFGFGIQQFFRATRGPDFSDLIGPRSFGLTMIVIGLLALLLAGLQHRSAIEALKLSYPEREHYPTIRHSNAWLLGILIALLGPLAIVSALFRG